MLAQAATMSYETAAGYAAVMTGAMGTLLGATGRAMERAYDRALAPGSVKTNFSLSFIVALGVNIATAIMGLSNPWMLPLGIIVDTVMLGAVMTATHFVFDLIWSSATGAWDLIKGSGSWIAQKVRNISVLFSLRKLPKDESTDPLRKAAAEAMKAVN